MRPPCLIYLLYTNTRVVYSADHHSSADRLIAPSGIGAGWYIFTRYVFLQPMQEARRVRLD